ncbi:MAG: hypothetical protein AAF202_10395 [Pseudomonadota bacterium]
MGIQTVAILGVLGLAVALIITKVHRADIGSPLMCLRVAQLLRSEQKTPAKTRPLG